MLIITPTLLGTSHHPINLNPSRIDHIISKILSLDQGSTMVTEITDIDIKNTFWSLNSHKALRPDGYNAGFFKKAWPGHEVTAGVRAFFRSGLNF